MVFELPLLLVLLVVCSFAPGFFFVRRLAWTPLEKLCGSIALSLVLVYLAAWALFCFGPDDQRAAYWIVAAAAVAAGAAARKDIGPFARSFRIRQSLAWFGALLAWTLLILAIIRVYSGGGWYGDWLEHFQRALFFLHRLPAGIVVFPFYQLTARPPLMNVVTAFFLGLTQDRFELFQVVFAFLNLLMFLPCLLILPALGGSRRRAAAPLAVLFAASPAVMQAATYTWTKALPAFFIVLALALYLAGLRKNDGFRIAAAFVSLAAGLLAHYSAGPYLVLVTAHYAIRVVRRREWRRAAAIAAVCGPLLATWFAWSIATYGWKGTVASNTSVSGAEQHRGSNLQKVGANLFDTIVPLWLRGSLPYWPPAKGTPAVRDAAFALYQMNLVFAMGIVGGPLVLVLAMRALRRRGRSRRERRFWGILIVGGVVLGVAVVGERDPFGVPHLTLLTLEVLGLALIAAYFASFRRAVRLLVILGLAVDFWFGIFLQARVENLENSPARTVFADGFAVDHPERSLATAADVVSRNTWDNWRAKHRYQLSDLWLHELPKRYGTLPAFASDWARREPRLWENLREDELNWGGWWRAHGGSTTYLGDWAGGLGSNVAEGLMCAAFFGMIALLFFTHRAPAKVIDFRANLPNTQGSHPGGSHGSRTAAGSGTEKP